MELRNKKTKTGFTLIEMLVVIAIFTIISSIVLFKQSEFSSDLIVSNLAYEIALEIRQAQTYGIGVRGTGPADALQYTSGYGVHFGSDTLPSSFVLFADTTDPSGTAGNDGVFQGGNDPFKDTVVDTFKLPGGNVITDIFYTSDGTTYTYKPTPGGISDLDITFRRPQPDALIIVNGDTTRQLSKVSIIVASSLGDKCEEIDVYATGQISVDPSPVSCTL